MDDPLSIFTQLELEMQLVDKTVGAIAAAENLTDDRRKLMLIGSQVAIDVLKAAPGARSLWQDPPPCFVGHPSIMGSFAGVPVARLEQPEMDPRTFALMLGQRLVSVIGGF